MNNQNESIQLDLTLYVVRNQRGEFFRSKGYGGYGKSWVDDITSARIYGKLGPARSTVTYFTKEHEKYGIPDIVEIKIVEGVVIAAERERALKARDKINKVEEEREVRRQKDRLEQAQRDFEKAQKNLANLRKRQKREHGA